MKIYQMFFNLQSRHKYMIEMAMFNVQRAITPKVGKPELQFHDFCNMSPGASNVCEVSSKYLKPFPFTEWTLVHGRNDYFQYLPQSKGHTPKVG